MENGICRLGPVLHGFLVHGLGLLIHAPLLKVLGPGHVKGSGPGTDAAAKDATEQRDWVGIITGLEEKVDMRSKGEKVRVFTVRPRDAYTSDAVVDVSDVIGVLRHVQEALYKPVQHR